MTVKVCDRCGVIISTGGSTIAEGPQTPGNTSDLCQTCLDKFGQFMLGNELALTGGGAVGKAQAAAQAQEASQTAT